MASLLICSSPIHGHVTPLLAVASYLVDRGHRVRFLTGELYRDAVVKTGAEYLALPHEADYGADLNASFPERVGLKGPAGIRYDITTIFLEPLPAQLRAVDAAIAAEPVDAVFAEAAFFGAAALLARPRAARPPVIYLGILPLGLKSPDAAPMGLGIPPMRGVLGRIRNALLTMVAEKIVFAPVQRRAEELVLAATGHPLKHPALNWPATADAIVQFTVPGFEYPRRNLPASVHFVGPVSRTVPSTKPLPEWWHELDGSRPIVHVTQGTIANTDYEELIAPTIRGLADEDVLVVVSTGGRDVSTLGPLPENVRAASYLPYDKLLPLTTVMVTNGGYGGVHYALEHGVPLVVAGETEDKIEVTARVGWSKAGVNLKTNSPSASQVAKAVRTVLRSPRYSDASTAIAAEIADAPGLARIEEVVRELAGR